MNTNNTFYRIAHKVTARGVYSHNRYCLENDNLLEYYYEDIDDMAYSHNDNKLKTPCLRDNSLLHISENFNNNLDLQAEIKQEESKYTNIYCFNSIDQLKSWFTDDELSLLHSKMFHIIEFSVNEQLGCYKVYDKQCIVPLVCFLDDDITSINKCVSINTILG